MALTAVHVSDVPNLDQVPDKAPLYATRFSQGIEIGRTSKFLVVGHRGNGMNLLHSADRRMNALKENSILSFNAAANYPIDFIEFDVQGTVYERRITELSLAEFLSYGPQKEEGLTGKPLMRKTKDGKIVSWTVETDDSACTLKEAFEKVNPSIGFNIELKFDDHIVYQQDYLIHVLKAVLHVVLEYAKGRPIIFSSFQPDAALLVKKLQTCYPVFFLTNGGTEIYYDVRRNSLEEATKLCLEGGLEGIVSEVKGIFRNPGLVNKIKESKLSLLTYGKLNNVPEAVYMQHLMGIDGVIVDFVEQVTDAVCKLVKKPDEILLEGEEKVQNRPQFSQRELSFLLKLIPELIQQ
ncbi:glycerophosphodiester phosphodiesterase GDPD1, chloroplastic-like isoform X2 [Solanum pennellii]|uniref:glycerophosphodiester phosphodiesterase n=1 Tax=Solanum pennellii TaxID=28526 RepID=A0ABM1V585_SOLPN|nr:glycerophosphodiester phosphodiesterase GDPD1, chloroplastic-like isoform X2 [Solanum pennellii]